MTGSLNDEYYNKCELYSLDEDRWSELPDLLTGRYQHSMTAMNQRFLYVYGGEEFYTGDGQTNSIERLDLLNL